MREEGVGEGVKGGGLRESTVELKVESSGGGVGMGVEEGVVGLLSNGGTSVGGGGETERFCCCGTIS